MVRRDAPKPNQIMGGREPGQILVMPYGAGAVWAWRVKPETLDLFDVATGEAALAKLGRDFFSGMKKHLKYALREAIEAHGAQGNTRH